MCTITLVTHMHKTIYKLLPLQWQSRSCLSSPKNSRIRLQLRALDFSPCRPAVYIALHYTITLILLTCHKEMTRSESQFLWPGDKLLKSPALVSQFATVKPTRCTIPQTCFILVQHTTCFERSLRPSSEV